MAKEKKKWIQGLDLKKGALRRELKVKKGKDIPVTKLEKAAKSKNPTLKKRAVLALNFRKMRKK
jgi:trehalose/maltose hydrolase-like predicted phosphorylase